LGQSLARGDFDALTGALVEAGLKFGRGGDFTSCCNWWGWLLEQHDQDNESARIGGDAVRVGMRIGKSIGTIPTDLLLVGRAPPDCSTALRSSLIRAWITMEIVAHYA